MAPSDNEDERERSREHSEERGSAGEGNNSREEDNSREDREDREDSRDDNDELASKSLRIQSKRYYVDVKQNARGRFVKLVEGLPNGNKNRISFPMSTVPEVRDKLSSFADFYANMEPSSHNDEDDDKDNSRQSLKSEDIRAGQRRIYFDLKENKRGVYLRISSTAQYSSQRHTIALPAQGIVDVRNVLTEFNEKFGGEEAGEPEELPEFQEMRIERKRFYFDCGSNDRGSFLRVSEVTNRYRSSITIPKQGLSKFKEILDDMMSKMEG